MEWIHGGVLVIIDIFVIVGIPEDIRTGISQDNVTLIINIERIINLDTLFLGVTPSPVHTLVTTQRIAELLLQAVILDVLPDLRVECWRVFDLYFYFYFWFLIWVLVDWHVLFLVFIHYLLLYHLFLLYQRIFLIHFRLWR